MQMDANAISIYIDYRALLLGCLGRIDFRSSENQASARQATEVEILLRSRAKCSTRFSLTHLTADRYQWVKIQVDNSSSTKRYHATKKLEEADEKLKLARQSLADDNLLGSNEACEAALKLIDAAEQDIAG